MIESSAEDCVVCGGETVIGPVPDDCRDLVAGDTGTVLVCRRCLAIEPTDESITEMTPVVTDISSALPSDAEAAVAVVILVELLESLALNRREIETVVDYLERNGVDPLLALDRLANERRTTDRVDLDRRQHQLAQVLGQS